MTNAGLDIIRLHIFRDAGAERMCCLRLADPGDVVFFALDRHQGDAADFGWLHETRTAVAVDTPCQMVFLEHALDGLQVEFFSQVEHREVFVVEFAVPAGIVAVTADKVVEELPLRVNVAGPVHVHEGRELHEARINPAQHARIRARHGVDHVLLEPGEGALFGQLVGHGGRQARIDRRAHEGHRGRQRGIFFLGHHRDGGQHGRAGLADGEDMRAAAKMRQHLADMVDIVVEIEPAEPDRRHPGVCPVGDVDVMRREEAFDRSAQQRCIMARQRRNDQQAGQRRRAGAPGGGENVRILLEVHKSAPGRAPGDFRPDRHGHAVDAHRVDAPFGLAVIPGRALEHVRHGGKGLAITRLAERVQGRGQRGQARLGGQAHGRHRDPVHLDEGIEHRLTDPSCCAAA